MKTWSSHSTRFGIRNRPSTYKTAKRQFYPKGVGGLGDGGITKSRGEVTGQVGTVRYRWHTEGRPQQGMPEEMRRPK